MNDLIDFTGKLNKKEDYLKMLNLLELKTKIIKMVVLDLKEYNEFISLFNNFLIDKKEIKGSFMTISNIKNVIYSFKASKKMFDYLRTFETFCKYYRYGENERSKKIGDYSERTSFGIDDIAFFDENGEVLLWTCTHEGYIEISEKLNIG